MKTPKTKAKLKRLDYYIQAEIAQIEGVSRNAVNDAIRKGRLRPTHTTALGSIELFSRAEVDAWRARRREVGPRGPESKTPREKVRMPKKSK